MPKLTDALTTEHRRCDAIFVEAEEAVSKGDWDKASVLFKEFDEAIEQHFLMEETILFPAYSAKTNLRSVTDALMQEHMQMRIMIYEAGEDIKAKNQEQFLGKAETLLILMQQHNRKEERKMYTMADSSLRGDIDDLLDRMGMG